MGLLILVLWLSHLVYLFLTPELTWTTPMSFVHIFVQAYLTAGLFITAHDALHGAVSKTKWINETIGKISCLFFAGISYRDLIDNHKNHHAFPATERDPDFNVSSQNFFVWFSKFIIGYVTWKQLILMAILYNVFHYVFGISESSIWMFWVIPSLLGSLQLFYFGTYMPHRLPFTEDMMPHKSRSQNVNLFFAVLSCYNFGYHWEHHESPSTPWYMLWKIKELRLQ